MMIDLFMRDAENGAFVPVVNPGAEWVLDEPSVATREYNGILMRLTRGKHGNEGWQFLSELKDNPEWHPVFPRLRLRDVFTGKYPESNFSHVEEFSKACLEYADDYELGEYWLAPPLEGDTWRLIPVARAEQLSNVNELELHKLLGLYLGDEAKAAEDAFDVLEWALAPLREDVYGVIFTHEDGRKVRARLNDFDWKEYDRTNA